jgi:hypothetical protein
MKISSVLLAMSMRIFTTKYARDKEIIRLTHVS